MYTCQEGKVRLLGEIYMSRTYSLFVLVLCELGLSVRLFGKMLMSNTNILSVVVMYKGQGRIVRLLGDVLM
jgi:hypothetical protein